MSLFDIDIGNSSGFYSLNYYNIGQLLSPYYVKRFCFLKGKKEKDQIFFSIFLMFL